MPDDDFTRTSASSYRTGHLPEMTYRELVAHHNARSFLYDAPTAAEKPPKERKGSSPKSGRRRRKSAVQRILDQLDSLSPSQLEALAGRLAAKT